MTKKELKEHCERQVQACEMWAKRRGQEPSGKIYEEHKLILDLIQELEQPCEDEDVQRVVDYLLKPVTKSTTSDDCVSRAEVIDELNRLGRNAFKDDTDYDNFFAFVDSVPPVTPTQSWIPASERLPEEDGEYLLFGKIDEDEENYIFIGEYDSCGEQFGIWQEQFDRTTLGCLGSEFFEYSSVIAWQPLPQAYEEKRGDKDDNN